MKKLIILFAAACLLTACDKDKDEEYIAQYFFGKNSKNQNSSHRSDNRNTARAKACESLQKVNDVYMRYRSADELKEHADEISIIDDVEEVYFSDIAMIVKVKGYMSVSYCLNPEQKAP